MRTRTLARYATATAGGLKPARLRKILLERGSYDWCDTAIHVRPSPDRRHAMVFSHGSEMTMMNMRYFFTLFDRKGGMLDKFEPAAAVDNHCAWSADSRLVAVPIAIKHEALFIADVERSMFAVIRLSNRQCRFRFDGAKALRIEFDREQLAAINSDRVFSGDKAAWPIRRFRAPAPRSVKEGSLDWHPRTAMARLPRLVAAAALLDMEPVPDGFYPFRGRYPASTTDVYNGRPMEVAHLVAFAEFGDRQAQRWLAPIKKKAKAGKSVSQWDPVSKHLGRRTRTVDP